MHLTHNSMSPTGRHVPMFIPPCLSLRGGLWFMSGQLWDYFQNIKVQRDSGQREIRRAILITFPR
jgi:hypothetical protein